MNLHKTVVSGYKFFSCSASCSTLSVSVTCVCGGVGGGVAGREHTHKLDELDLYVQTQIYINTDSHTHIDQHTPVLCHLDCPPGWTDVVVVCMQTGLLLSPGHCWKVRQLEMPRLPVSYLGGKERRSRKGGIARPPSSLHTWLMGICVSNTSELGLQHDRYISDLEGKRREEERKGVEEGGEEGGRGKRR